MSWCKTLYVYRLIDFLSSPAPPPTPKVNNGPVSWCKVEVAVQNPKSINRLTGDKLPPTPPVVTMSLSMKTVVSPRTHTHEVVALSALVHREVMLDGASDEDGRKVLCVYIRALHVNIMFT